MHSDATISFRLAVPGEKERFEVTLPVPGRHNVGNALAAVAVAREAGYRLADYPAIEAWIARFKALPWYAPITEP